MRLNILATLLLLSLALPLLADDTPPAIIAPAAAPDASVAAYVQQQQSTLPKSGQLLIDGSALGQFRTTFNDSTNSALTVVPVEGKPFTQALHVEVFQRQNPPNRVQIESPANTVAIKKGDVLFVSYWGRTLAAQDETGQATVGTFLQTQSMPRINTLSTTVRLTREWTQRYETAVASQDFAPGTLGLNLPIGYYPQTFELGGLYVLNLGPNVDVAKLPFNSITYADREADAPWRRAAAERIEKYRKGTFAINVVDAAGKPVPDAAVTVAMQRHAYNFGTFFDRLDFNPEKETPDAQRYRQFVKDNYSFVTSQIYWESIWLKPGNLEKHYALARWLKENDFRVKAHCIIWPAFRWLPAKARELKNDPAALREYCLDHVKVAARLTRELGYQQVDVMNEPRANHDLMDILGQDVMVDWFKTTREINPDIKLYINEYSILSGGGKDNKVHDSYAATIEYLIAHHAPLDGIGMQSHFGSELTPPTRVLEILDRFAKYGKELAVTEFDINILDQATQADYTRDFMTAFFSHPATTTFVMWGFWESSQWKPNGAMVRKDWSPKPNLQAYRDLIYKQWWTNTSGTTSATGDYHTRGFLGDYQITVEKQGRKVTLPATLTRDGTTLQVSLK